MFFNAESGKWDYYWKRGSIDGYKQDGHRERYP